MVHRSYKDLVAWQKARHWVAQVYDLSHALPADERFGLTSQLRRAAVSVVANIAEGHGRSGRREFHHHVSIALGSLAEAETLLILAADLKYVSDDRLEPIFTQSREIGRILNGLLRSLKTAPD